MYMATRRSLLRDSAVQLDEAAMAFSGLFEGKARFFWTGSFCKGLPEFPWQKLPAVGPPFGPFQSREGCT